MHFRTILPSILGITLATALNITYPRASSFILNTTSLTITWTTSSTDPPELNFVLTNTNASFVPMIIGTNISTSDLKLIAPIKGDVGSFRITVNNIASEAIRSLHRVRCSTSRILWSPRPRPLRRLHRARGLWLWREGTKDSLYLLLPMQWLSLRRHHITWHEILRVEADARPHRLPKKHCWAAPLYMAGVLLLLLGFD